MNDNKITLDDLTQHLNDLHEKFLIELKVSNAAFDERIKKIEETIKETSNNQKESAKISDEIDARLDKVAKMVGGISNNTGEFAEDLFYNTLNKNKEFGGVKFEEITRKVRLRYKGYEDEFDIVMINGTTIGLIEVKYRVHPKDLEDLITKKVENFRFLFPQYKDYKIILGIGGLSFESADIISEAENKGVGVLQISGDKVESYSNNIKFY